MVLMFDNIRFSYSTFLHGGRDLINIDFDFLHQMKECSLFKDRIHIKQRPSKQVSCEWLHVEEKRDPIFFPFLPAPDLDSNFFSFCGLLHW